MSVSRQIKLVGFVTLEIIPENWKEKIVSPDTGKEEWRVTDKEAFHIVRKDGNRTFDVKFGIEERDSLIDLLLASKGE